MSPPSDDHVALVLSGGGVRGAYEVGVVAGIIEVLGLEPGDPAPFSIFTGTSVGAINTAFLASYADRGDMNVHRLEDIWAGLTLLEDLEVDPFRLIGLRRPEFLRRDRTRRSGAGGRAILRAEPLDHLVRTETDWERLHANTDAGIVHACIVAALRMDNGRTTVFIETSPTCDFNPTRDPRRIAITTRLSHEHVLASAAIPFVFPPREIDGHLYADGGLRFNTPIAPAIRTGARRLVIISVRYPGELHPESPHAHVPPDQANSLAFLVGKLLNALLLDPLEYDLQVLHRFNVFMDVLDSTVDDENLAKVHRAIEEIRGQPYRRLQSLAFHPSEDIGLMATEHARSHGLSTGSGLSAKLKARGLEALLSNPSDLGSYLLFDGSYARRLIDLGRQDAHARKTTIRAFFGKL